MTTRVADRPPCPCPLGRDPALAHGTDQRTSRRRRRASCLEERRSPWRRARRRPPPRASARASGAATSAALRVANARRGCRTAVASPRSARRTARTRHVCAARRRARRERPVSDDSMTRAPERARVHDARAGPPRRRDPSSCTARDTRILRRARRASSTRRSHKSRRMPSASTSLAGWQTPAPNMSASSPRLPPRGRSEPTAPSSRSRRRFRRPEPRPKAGR